MYVTVERKQASILTIQRPKIAGNAKSRLLIYSRDGKIPIKLVPDVGDLSKALGNRLKANFLYTQNGSNIILGKEVYCRD